MNLGKLPLLLFLFLLCAWKNGYNKIVWTHIDDDLDKLYGNVKQITVISSEHLTKNVSIVFNIDKGGKEIESNMYFDGRYVKTRFVSKYDKSRHTEDFIGYTKVSIPNETQSLKDEIMSSVYKYDDKGRIIRFVNIAHNSRDSCIYKYNSFDDLIECDQYNSGRISSKEKFTYDNRHLIIKSLDEFGGNGTVDEKITYRYKTFDSQGNWLIRAIYSDDGSKTIETRKITYY